MQIIRGKEIVHKNPSQNKDYPYALSSILFETDQLFVSSELLGPGKKASAPHRHQLQDEIILVTKGELQVFEGTEKATLAGGDYVCFAANSHNDHYIENNSEKDAQFILIRRSKHLHGDVRY